MNCVELFNPCAARPGPRRRALERVGRDRWYDPNANKYDFSVEPVPRAPSLSATG
jgi:hypothetical protein